VIGAVEVKIANLTMMTAVEAEVSKVNHTVTAAPATMEVGNASPALMEVSVGKEVQRTVRRAKAATTTAVAREVPKVHLASTMTVVAEDRGAIRVLTIRVETDRVRSAHPASTITEVTEGREGDTMRITATAEGKPAT